MTLVLLVPLGPVLYIPVRLAQGGPRRGRGVRPPGHWSGAARVEGRLCRAPCSRCQHLRHLVCVGNTDTQAHLDLRTQAGLATRSHATRVHTAVRRAAGGRPESTKVISQLPRGRDRGRARPVTCRVPWALMWRAVGFLEEAVLGSGGRGSRIKTVWDGLSGQRGQLG